MIHERSVRAKLVTDLGDDVLGMLPKFDNGRTHGIGEDHLSTGEARFTAQTPTMVCISHNRSEDQSGRELFNQAHLWDTEELRFGIKARTAESLSLFDEANKGCALCL